MEGSASLSRRELLARRTWIAENPQPYGVPMSGLILIVEDEPQLAEVLEAYARQEGYRTERAADGTPPSPCTELPTRT